MKLPAWHLDKIAELHRRLLPREACKSLGSAASNRGRAEPPADVSHGRRLAHADVVGDGVHV
jgi:hypothetical protein